MIILEGPDRVGKTTVAKALRAALPGWSYRHHTLPPVAPWSYFGWFLADAVPRVIVDRMYWSEYAYGLTYRGKTDIDEHHWRLLDLMAASRGATILRLTDFIDNIHTRWNDKTEMWSQQKLPELMQHFDNLEACATMPWDSHLPCVTCTAVDLLGPELNTPTNMFYDTVNYEITRANRAARLPAPSVGYGSTTPGFIVLGEQPGDVELKDFGPHVAMADGPAMEWMWRAIMASQVNWWQGYYINACDFVDRGHFRGTVKYLDATTIVALGAKAHHLAYNNSDANVFMSAHPSYLRRFHHREFDDFVDFWKSALEEYRCHRKD